MAASETREGPGWWMASDGGWNPPEMWPESTPPLPGWVRQPDGSWKAPLEKAPVAETQLLDVSKTANGQAVIDLTTLRVSSKAEVNATGPTIARGGQSVELPALRDAPKIRETPTLANARPTHDRSAEEGPTLSFAPKSTVTEVDPATAASVRERDPRVLALWLVVAILGCIAGLLAVLVLL